MSLQASLDSWIARAQKPVEPTDSHLLTLFALALSIRGSLYLELGVKHARSTAPLLHAAHLNSGKLISVDKLTSQYDPPEELRQTWEFRQQDALEFLKNETRRFDLIFIDDWHSYSHVSQELTEIDRLTGPGAIILVHDVMLTGGPFYYVDLMAPRESQFGEGGPYRALASLPQEFWEFASLPYGFGLALLRKKRSSKYWPR